VKANGGNGTVDLRGTFIRSLDDGRGIDSNRGVGTRQNSLVGDHYHGTGAFDGSGNDNWYSITGSWNDGRSYQGRWVPGDSERVQTRTVRGNEGSSIATRTSNQINISNNDNRPVNVALLACYKT
jgi:hypothetical protein